MDHKRDGRFAWALSVSGNASGMTGIIDAPAAQLTESGNALLNAALNLARMIIPVPGTARTPVLQARVVDALLEGTRRKRSLLDRDTPA